MKIWLDDERPMPPEFDVWLRTAQSAINVLRVGGITHISLDHDLGGELTGYDVAKYIEEAAYNKTLAPMEVTIHSANAVGRKNMDVAIRRAQMFWADW